MEFIDEVHVSEPGLIVLDVTAHEGARVLAIPDGGSLEPACESPDTTPSRAGC
ncbi:DUF6207 family protein [Streptomyces sp. WZ.A104]|uniref:DUF6207 family protein n=1 Tax=Streptomyces sp. WZ.A104 TaxID=2023771 RepID=UPI00359CA4CA